MHETIFAKQIIEEAEKQAAGRKIKSITVEVGDLAHVPLDDLKHILDRMVRYNVNYLPKKAKVKCSCGFSGEPEILEKGHDLNIFTCPECGKVPKVIEGDQIILKKVEI